MNAKMIMSATITFTGVTTDLQLEYIKKEMSGFDKPCRVKLISQSPNPEGQGDDYVYEVTGTKGLSVEGKEIALPAENAPTGDTAPTGAV